MNYCVYQFSKPFQYFNIKNLPEPNVENAFKVLVAIRAFAGFDEFVENIKAIDRAGWDEIVVVDSERGLLKYLLTHKVNLLYTPYDFSTLLGCVVFLKRFKVYWFEEGLTTYMKPYDIKPLARRIVDRFLGVGTSMGLSDFTIGRYVYRQDIFLKIFKENQKPLLNYKYDFRKALSVYSDLFFELSATDKGQFEKFKNKNIAIYLTDWEIKDAVLRELEMKASKYDVFFIKPHPHILSKGLEFSSFFTVIKSNILFEFIVQCFIDNGNALTVYHHNSNAVLHFLKDATVISLESPSEMNSSARDVYELFSL